MRIGMDRSTVVGAALCVRGYSQLLLSATETITKVPAPTIPMAKNFARISPMIRIRLHSTLVAAPKLTLKLLQVLGLSPTARGQAFGVANRQHASTITEARAATDASAREAASLLNHADQMLARR
jgi:hypothetical protein